MKNKILAVMALVVMAVGVVFAGEYYVDYLKSDVIIVMRRLGLGTMSPSTDYMVDVVGDVHVNGDVSMTGAPSITGSPDVIGELTVSTASTSGTSLCFKGAYVTLPSAGTEGCVAYQSSDHKLYIATATGSGVWVATH